MPPPPPPWRASEQAPRADGRRHFAPRPTFLQPLNNGGPPADALVQRRHFRTPETSIFNDPPSARRPPRQGATPGRVTPVARGAPLYTPVARTVASRAGAHSAGTPAQRQLSAAAAHKRADGPGSYGTPAQAYSAQPNRRQLPRSTPLGRAPLADLSPAGYAPRAATKAWPAPTGMLPRIGPANAAAAAGAHAHGPAGPTAAMQTPVGGRRAPASQVGSGVRPTLRVGEASDGGSAQEALDGDDEEEAAAELERSRHVAFTSPLHESFYYTKRSANSSTNTSSAFGESTHTTDDDHAPPAPGTADADHATRGQPFARKHGYNTRGTGATGALLHPASGGQPAGARAARPSADRLGGRARPAAGDPAREQALDALFRQLVEVSSSASAAGLTPSAESPRRGDEDAPEPLGRAGRAHRPIPFALAQPGTKYREGQAKARAPVDFGKSLNFAGIDVRAARKLGAAVLWR